VALGTSLPELVTSIAAARKNELEMAIGNVVGSNVFNILMILGVAATVSPIAFNMENVIDIAVLLVFSLITWLFCVTKKRLGRWKASPWCFCMRYTWFISVCDKMEKVFE
jgi:cation:H+ antiporter